MSNEIATYSMILSKLSLGKSGTECPTKTQILAINSLIVIDNASTYGANECVKIDDIRKKAETWNYYLTVSPTSMSFGAGGGSKQFTYSSYKRKVLDGVEQSGEQGPYRQSERREIYKKYVQILLENGKAYIAFDTPEELDAKRAEIANFQYDASTRGMMRNSLTMPKEEVDALIAEGKQYVVRFKIEPNEDIHVNDLIRGEVVINSSILDDKVLYKSADELPTYHLANIVDDHLMEVSHVIRGEEWLPSAPLHVLLYRAFGWEDTMPEFAHLPLLLKPEGNGKLSKRDGDRLGFPVFPLEWHDPKSGEISSGYRESGYLPEAVINFLALLGWNPGNDQEVMSMDELIKLFDLHYDFYLYHFYSYHPSPQVSALYHTHFFHPDFLFRSLLQFRPVFYHTDISFRSFPVSF